MSTVCLLSGGMGGIWGELIGGRVSRGRGGCGVLVRLEYLREGF